MNIIKQYVKKYTKKELVVMLLALMKTSDQLKEHEDDLHMLVMSRDMQIGLSKSLELDLKKVYTQQTKMQLVDTVHKIASTNVVLECQNQILSYLLGVRSQINICEEGVMQDENTRN